MPTVRETTILNLLALAHHSSIKTTYHNTLHLHTITFYYATRLDLLCQILLFIKFT